MNAVAQKMAGLFVLLGALAAPSAARACTVCFAAPDAPETNAISMAMLFMLGVIGSVMAGIGAFAFSLARRANMPAPPHQQFERIPEPEAGHSNA